MQSTVNYSYGNTSWGDLLTGYNGQTISSDAIGNMTSDGTWTYTWERGRQLASMSNGSATWSYTYNNDGMRVKRTNGSTTYTYYYNGDLLRYLDINGTKLYFVLDANSQPLEVSYQPAGTSGIQIYYFVMNLQGDVTAIVDTSGNPVVQYSYDAWGKILSVTGSMANTLGAQNPFRYRGYVYDNETGVYYLQSRYYDPEMGRFINADVFASTGQGLLGNNMFAYCGNNPIVRIDTSGKAFETPLDVASLILSAAELAANPTDLWAIASFSGDLLDVLLPVVTGLGETIRVFKAADSIGDVVSYTTKVTGQMEKASDLFHAFPTVIDSIVDMTKTEPLLEQGDKIIRLVVKNDGYINDIWGYFEYIFETDGLCNHRLFKEYK